MAARKKAIEFLPQEEWQKGTLGHLLKWALTVGRFIVVFTELIVILAFLSRFKFDRDLTDLNEAVSQKKAIVEAAAGFEQDFRFLQKQLETIASLKKNRLATSLILQEVGALMPPDVSLANFAVEDSTASFTATALSESGLSSFLTNLKNSTRFKNLSLTQVATGTDQKEVGIQFQLKTALAGGGK